MTKISKALLLVLSALSFTSAAVKQVQQNNQLNNVSQQQGTCQRISSSLCTEFPEINASVPQTTFDTLVQTKINQLKSSLKGAGMCTTFDTDFTSNVRYLKTVACAIVIREQNCNTPSALCPSVCTQFKMSFGTMSCINQQSLNSIVSQCTPLAVRKNGCLEYYDVELDTCGFDSPASKTSYCANSTEKCCGGNGLNTTGAAAVPQTSPTIPQTTEDTTSTTTSEPTETTEPEKKKSGGFFTSKTFIILLSIFAVIVALLGYFYYVGSKDEKEENMRNLENGNNRSYGNNYGQTQTVEVNKNLNIGGNNYDSRSPYDEKPSYGIPTSSAADPFSDNNRVDAVTPYNTSYNDVQNSTSYQNAGLVAASADKKVENPFDSPKLDPENDFETQINKSMQEISKNFSADDMPTPSVVKLTSIDKPQQGNTSTEEDSKKNDNADDILKPSMVRMTNIETPVPSNTIPTDKDINIGDDILKPSMVKLTEIQTPQETSINSEVQDNEKDGQAADEEPKKAVVNMIDLKTPDSNEALNAGNLTPSILITSADGKTNSQDEEIPEEYSEMPEPRPFRAIHAYEPQIDDELRLEVDNEIDVLYEYDDGWCWAINKTSGEQGACPLLCLVSAKEEASGERDWEKEMDVMKVPGRRESMLSNSFDTSHLNIIEY
ncbi:hypothetical protein PIROE2DRAFT_20923 [Piromyces sp. E2]|nr:hypothetical protein PIROE2DRAFT_20923 [Piromyces sp. E2]|eukprot:OUM61607.1 hypothetical protein PIROE2DRAFT_20923 [Piromyces sp. E2]